MSVSRRLTLAAACLLARVPAVCGQQTFAEWLKQDQQAFQQYQAETTKAYQKFVEDDQKAFQQFVQQAGAMWGKQNVWVPEQKVWVQYTEDLEERSSVDLEHGTVRVQVLVDSAAPVAKEDLDRALEVGVERAVLSGTEDPVDMMKRQAQAGAAVPRLKFRALDQIPEFTSYQVKYGDSFWGLSRRYDIARDALGKLNRLDPQSELVQGRRMLVPYVAQPTWVAQPVQVSPSPVLANQVKMGDGTPVSKANAGQFAAAVVSAQAPHVEVVDSGDGRKRQSVTVAFPLVPEHLRIRAERYRPQVDKYAHKYDVYPPLVYAIIQTESAFNPRARSGVPAFGLMQLVPQSAARDAYLLVHGEDKLVTDAYLFDPERNIELGTAFLHLLDSRYLKSINQPASRMYCSIAAYNTGAGNVCRAFTQKTSVTQAAPVINGMSPDQVFETLRASLPYQETRDYVVRVRDRIPQYQVWR